MIKPRFLNKNGFILTNLFAWNSWKPFYQFSTKCISTWRFEKTWLIEILFSCIFKMTNMLFDKLGCLKYIFSVIYISSSDLAELLTHANIFQLSKWNLTEYQNSVWKTWLRTNTETFPEKSKSWIFDRHCLIINIHFDRLGPAMMEEAHFYCMGLFWFTWIRETFEIFSYFSTRKIHLSTFSCVCCYKWNNINYRNNF